MKECGSKFSYEIVEGEAPAPRPPSPSPSAACLSAEAAREDSYTAGALAELHSPAGTEALQCRLHALLEMDFDPQCIQLH